MQHFDVVVVGAGQAGAQLAISLREKGFAGTLALLGDEPDLPYERPPLSKAYLSGEVDQASLALRPAAFWADHHVALLLGERATAIDPAGHALRCESGRVLNYGSLAWTAGGRARELECPGAQLAGVHVVRTRAHVDALRDACAGARRAVIIGGGYIGLETAAVLAKAGCEVVVLEAAERVLARVTSPAVSAFFETEHRKHGVQVRTGCSVVALAGDDRVREVVLSDGTCVPADLVIVGIGLVPEVDVLRMAGARCGNGVEVDGRCRTTLPDVYAAGDCASHVNRFASGARVRLESVQNANDQARVAAANLAGVPTEYSAVPWFWSQQYDLKLQTVGLLAGHDEAVQRGSPGSRSFSVVYLRGGQVVALDCINAPRDFVLGKKLVTVGAQAGAADLADPAHDLAKIAARLA